MTRRRLTPAVVPLESRALLAPIIQQPGDLYAQENSVATVQVEATGAGPIRYNFAVAPPSDVAIDPVSGVLTYVAPAYQEVVHVGVTATDATGTATVWFSLLSFDQPPLVGAGGNIAIGVGSNLARSGSFFDPDPTDTFTASVDFGDGTGQSGLVLQGKQFQLNHTYAAVGNYLVTVIVTDSQQRTGFGYFTVDVAAQPPSPTPPSPVNAGPGNPPGAVASVGSVAAPAGQMVTNAVAPLVAFVRRHKIHRPHVHFPAKGHK